MAKYVYRFGDVSIPVYDEEETCRRLDIHYRKLLSYVNVGLLCSLSVPGFGAVASPGMRIMFPCEEIDWIGIELVVYPNCSVLNILKRRCEVNGPIFQLQLDKE